MTLHPYFRPSSQRILVAGVLCAFLSAPRTDATSRPHVSEEAEPHPGIACAETGFDFSKSSPVEFLEFLKGFARPGEASSIRGYIVSCVHKGWIRDEDISGLLALMDSKEQCGWVAMSISSYIEPSFSTVGDEAAFLIMGHKKEEYPPSLNSTRPRITAEDKAALRLWWTEKAIRR